MSAEDDAIPSEEIPCEEAPASESVKSSSTHVFTKLKHEAVKHAAVTSADRVKEFASLTGEAGKRVADRAANFKSPTKAESSPAPQSGEKKGPSAADKFRQAGAGAGLGDRCKSCEKMVYTAEKIIAQGFSWHKFCFTCGHKTGNGCNKVLLAGGYEEHGGTAYCKNCSRKLFQGQVSTLATKGGWTGNKPISHGALGQVTTVPNTGKPIPVVGAPPAAPAPAAPARVEAASAPSEDSAAAPPAAPAAEPAEASEEDSPAAATTVESEEPLEGDAAAAAPAAEGQEGYAAEGQEGYAAEGQEGYYAEGQEGYYATEGQEGYYAAEGQEGYYAAEGQEGYYAAEGQEGYAAEGQEGYYAAEGQEGYYAAEGQEGAAAAATTEAGAEGTYEQYQDEHHYGEGEEPAASAESGERTVAYYECPYTSPFDKKGAIYWVGTSGHQIEFENPQVTGLVYVEISTLYRGQLVNITSFAEQATAAERIAFATYTNNQPRSWLLVDFGPERRLRPSYYCVKHGASGVGNALRNWVLEGKTDETSDWVMLSKHVKDTALKDEPGSTAGFEITSDAAKSSFFRMFRLTQTGKNSGNNDCLFVGGIEFYGILQVSHSSTALLFCLNPSPACSLYPTSLPPSPPTFRSCFESSMALHLYFIVRIEGGKSQSVFLGAQECEDTDRPQLVMEKKV